MIVASGENVKSPAFVVLEILGGGEASPQQDASRLENKKML